MIRKVSFAALAVLGCTAAGAAADHRIRSLAYDPEHIAQIIGKPGIQSTIEFADDERIEAAVVRPLTYAHLVFATNMADSARGALVARLGEKACAVEPLDVERE